MVLQHRRTLPIVTGASKGIGKEIALQMACTVEKGSAFLITARSESALLEVKSQIRERCEDAEVWIVVCDMGNFNDETVLSTFDQILHEITEKEQFYTMFIYHNCGTVGIINKKASQLCDGNQWRREFDINVVNMIQFNNMVLKYIGEQVSPRRFIINITSLLAIQAFPSLVQYGVTKAAREAFFRGLACEEPGLRILSYSPGPVDTDMHDMVAEQSYDPTIRASFQRHADNQDAGVNRKTLTAQETVSKLLGIIQKNTFESGSRIDYFDAE
ncbi:hypothetical protein WR25_07529 [Diploscapter pachys]|uniref:Sepiapterin reductase n=1 Tax=Diploscapter pachys TaxID=2018661 RepID=A0A2A2JK72_9BILA|nr:hypothetical protein WR25_07529 [Diploscapter pachys]